MDYKIALIPGDGIGPEIVREAKKVLDKVCEKYGHSFSYSEVLLGGASIDVHGVPLTDEAIATAKSSDAVLMGSIGGDAKTSPWYKLEPSKRPEAGLLAIRKALNLFANLRPAYLYNELRKACPLRDEIIGDGFDMIIVRELTGGLYFGERQTIEENGVKKAIDTLSYNENEIRRIAIKAFEIGPGREMVFQKSAFLASEAGVELSVFFNKKFSSGLFGGEGFIMQKVSGQGTVFAEFDGHVVEYELNAGQEIVVDTGHLAAMDASCQIEIKSVPGVKNMLFGGEGIFNTIIHGPGKVWLQTMPISSVADSLRPYFPTSSK